MCDPRRVLKDLERNIEDLPYEVIDISFAIAFKPGAAVPEEPLAK